MEQTGHLACLLPFPEPKAVINRIQEQHPQLKISYRQISLRVDWKKADELPDDFWQDVTVLYTFSQFPQSPKLAPNLKLIHLFTSAADHVKAMPIWKESSIPFTTCTGVPAPAITEWVVMSMLVASRKYNMVHDWQLKHAWDGTGTGQGKSIFSSSSSTVGKRIGILGYGSIGRQVASVCKALGMTIIAFTANRRDTSEDRIYAGYNVAGLGDPKGEVPSEWFWGTTNKVSLHEFLQRDLDYLLVSTPLTTKSKGLLGKEEFQILSKRNAFVINVSRGEILVQEDLIEALETYARDPSEGLSGAALDVATPEPLPPDNPLWDAPNCIISPHISGNTREYGQYAAELLEENLRRMAKGDRLLNLVDRETGYSSASAIVSGKL